MDGLEHLRKIIEEIDDAAECDELHKAHGDSGDSCGGRLCGECQMEALRKAADEIKTEMLIMRLETRLLRALREENSEIVEWVRDNGGIENVKKRLMPEGMEWLLDVWPRFEDGELVKIGDFIASPESGERREVDCINFFDDAWYFGLVGSSSERLDRRERVKRPPVLAADGEPLRDGETVYKLDDDRPYTLKRFDGDHVYINAGGSSFDIWTFPGKLTHERPVADTWERLEEDAGKEACEYFAHMPCGCETSEMLDETVEKCNAAKARDLVRRAKKLAGVL